MKHTVKKSLQKCNRLVTGVLVFAWGFACATSPLGRSQWMWVSSQQMEKMGEQAFHTLKEEERRWQAPAWEAYVDCVMKPLFRWVAGHPQSPTSWEVVLFDQPEANAFALPGGKIGIYRGLFQVATTDAELAAVVGHEMAHVIARHGAERVSQHLATQVGLKGVDLLMGERRSEWLALLGVGARLGFLLPFSRLQESEADSLGLEWMARVGFHPQESVTLWQKMKEAAGGRSPPELLSTHPDPAHRIEQLKSQLPQAMEWFAQAGPPPVCHRPVGH